VADFSSKDDAWFAEWTARWDAMQDAYVPHRREVFALIAEVLAERFPKKCRVMDIGAGAGTLAEEILNRVPGSTVLCLDVEPFLLEAARRRLSTFADRATVVRCDLRKEDFTAKIAEHAEKDGGRRGTRPTSTDPDGRGSDVGRVPYATKGSRPPKPRSGAPQDFRKEVFTTEITEHTDPDGRGSDVGRVAYATKGSRPPKPRSGAPQKEKNSFHAVVTSTTTHWFGEERLQALYTWAARVLTDDGLVQVFDHIPPDDPGLARLALDLNEAECARIFQQTGAMTWEAFWDDLGRELASPPSAALAASPSADYYDTVAKPAWGTQDGPETGHPLATHRKLLHAAGLPRTAILWRHLSDALLVAEH
jgi:ubiquinone/menaquinone biosynthesis C-methylase UbiE